MDSTLARATHYVDQHIDEHIVAIQRLIRQRSLSTSGGVGIRETAEMLRGDFAALGCRDAAVVETPGNPIAYGHLDAGAAKTLIAYFMYDTEAVLDEDQWVASPFEGRVVDRPPFGRCIIGRGAINTKGPMVAFLNAVRAIQATGERVPVNLKFIAEGEEELGSANLGAFIQQQAGRLGADALFFPMPRQDSNGKISISLGSRRGVIFQLECSGATWGRGPGQHDIHSGMGAIVDNPAHRLIDAIGSLVAENGTRILIEGFYDDALPPDAEQDALLDRLATQWDEHEFKQKNGVQTFIDGLTGRAALRRLLFEPTLGLRGIYGGDSRPGDVSVSMAIVPHRAVAKMNASLVPNMNKEDVARKIRTHLDRHGFQDITMTLRPGTTAEPGSWGRVRMSDGIVQALVRTYARFGLEADVWPLSPGGWPGHLFQKYLGTPFLTGGVGHGGRAHSSNEYLVVDGRGTIRGLADLEKSFLTLLYEFAAG